MELQKYWQAYLDSIPNTSAKTVNYAAEKFGDNDSLADKLGDLIVQGIKTATCSCLWEWESEGSEIPQVASKTIVLDSRSRPLCIIETTEVKVRSFSEVDAQFAFDEGENDRSLESWRREHWKYFSRVLPKIGKQPTPEMLLVCERFRVVYKNESDLSKSSFTT